MLLTSLLVLLNWSSDGGSLQCPITVMDRAVPLRLSPDPPSGEDSDKDQGGSGGGGHHHHPKLSEEILVSTTPPDDVLDPTPHMQMEPPVTTPAQQGRALPHRPGDSPVNGVETEGCALQNRDFSDAAIRTILAAIHDTS